MVTKLLPYFLMISLCAFVTEVSAQPVLLINTNDFLNTLSTHPEIEKHALLVSSNSDQPGNIRETQHQVFVNIFKRDALLVFQTCWLLGQEIREKEVSLHDILRIRNVEAPAILKQQIMFLECEGQIKVLRVKHREAARALQDYVSHEYGEQPVLPETGAWTSDFYSASDITDNAVEVPGIIPVIEDIHAMSISYRSLNGIIALQEKVIAKIRIQNNGAEMLKELHQLNTYKAARWSTFKQISERKADLFLQTGTLQEPSLSDGRISEGVESE